jgi:release factor glutamine methyltransferase
VITKPRKYAKTGTRNEVLREACNWLEAAGVPDWQASAEWLVCEALNCSRVELWSQPLVMVDVAGVVKLDEMLARRISREPVQYIVGYADFMGLRLSVDPRVLVPRPETELLAERVINYLDDRPDGRMLDIGTGSGCLSLAVKNMCRGVSVTACDVSESALEVATVNGEALGLEVSFVHADVLEVGFSASLGSRFDVIVSNPPYVPRSEMDSIMPEVRDHEPHGALFVSGDPISFYRVIVEHSDALLVERGLLLFETHPDYSDQVAELLSVAGFDDVQIHRDLAGHDRIVEGRL